MAKKPAASSSLPDFAGLSIDELTHLHHTVGKHLDAKKAARIKELQTELTALGGTDIGGIKVNVDKVRAGKAKQAAPGESGKSRAKPPVKFRDDKGNTWTGRGATPKWLAAYEAEGRNRSDFAV